jgi:hypothetical protein
MAQTVDLQLERIVSVNEASALVGVSDDTFRRHFPHLIRKISARRVGVKLRDVLAIGSEAATA